VLLLIVFILLGIAMGQNYSIYWLYPLLATLPILLKWQRALVIGVLSCAIGLPLVFLQLDTNAATVMGFSLAITWVVSAWLVFAVRMQSRRLRDMAVTDPLTGAYNRRYLEEQARQAIDAWRRNQQLSTLLILDVDHFKRINDKYGHAGGDAAIKSVVEVISKRLRAIDTLCRFGGEEFVVLLQQTGLAGATVLAEELRGLVESARILPEGSVTVSIGVSEVSTVETLDRWFKLADSGLYLAKRNGRNRVEMVTQVLAPTEHAARTLPQWR
jgi:diguanylate cyclase (GGDEF)-like protein